MSFFGRVLLTAAVVAGVAHVFRRDITRILGALQKPTEKFMKEVQKELDVQKVGSGMLGSSGAASGSSAEAAAKAAAGVQAAVDQAASSAGSSASSGSGSGDKGVEGSSAAGTAQGGAAPAHGSQGEASREGTLR